MTNPIHLWLDDERPMPPGYNLHCRTAREAIEALKLGGVEAISLDHDLGDPGVETGYAVAKFIEEAAFRGGLKAMRVHVHTANPVGRQNIMACLRNAERYWMEREAANKGAKA